MTEEQIPVGNRRPSQQNTRVLRYTRNKDDYHRLRVQKLKAIQKPELIWDNALISGLTSPRGTPDNDWGQNTASGLDFNHVFKTLDKITLKKFGEERRNEIVKHTAGGRFIEGYKTSIHPDVGATSSDSILYTTC